MIILFLNNPSGGVYQYLVYILSQLTDSFSFLNQQKRKNGHRNIFMTKFSRKNVQDVGVNLGSACNKLLQTASLATVMIVS